MVFSSQQAEAESHSGTRCASITAPVLESLGAQQASEASAEIEHSGVVFFVCWYFEYSKKVRKPILKIKPVQNTALFIVILLFSELLVSQPQLPEVLQFNFGITYKE